MLTRDIPTRSIPDYVHPCRQGIHGPTIRPNNPDWVCCWILLQPEGAIGMHSCIQRILRFGGSVYFPDTLPQRTIDFGGGIHVLRLVLL